LAARVCQHELGNTGLQALRLVVLNQMPAVREQVQAPELVAQRVGELARERYGHHGVALATDD
jgi:hypothetical protein